jgi:hypothetical protein
MHITVLILLFTVRCGVFCETEVHLLPAGYRGDVFIVPGIANGDSPHREGRAIVFQIPADGILVTQDRPSRRWHFSRFYYLHPDGKRQRLEYVASSISDTPENRADERPIAWFERSGTISGTDFPCTVNFVQYYVGSRGHLLSRARDSDELQFDAFIKRGHLCG